VRVFKKWSVAIIRVTLVPMLYCSACLSNGCPQVLDWFTQICLALKHVHDHRSVSAKSRMRSRMRSRMCESWRCALTRTHRQRNTVPVLQQSCSMDRLVWQCWSLHTRPCRQLTGCRMPLCDAASPPLCVAE
jgi:hypothetical protein